MRLGPFPCRVSATATFYVGYDSGMGLGAICAGLLAGAVGYTVVYRVFACLPVLALFILFLNTDKIRERDASS